MSVESVPLKVSRYLDLFSMKEEPNQAYLQYTVIVIFQLFLITFTYSVVLRIKPMFLCIDTMLSWTTPWATVKFLVPKYLW